MSNLADHELDRLRRERDALDDANTKLGDQLIDARTERDEAQAAAARLREALEVAQVWLDELREEFRRGALEDNAHRGGYLSNKNVEVEVQARKALAPAPGPAGERQEAVVEMDEDSDVRKLLERHPLP